MSQATQYAFDVADFQAQVIDASHRVPVIVDFWAPWCGPCKVLKPILEKLAAEYGGRFLLAKVNSDDHQELAARLRVRGIPNVKAFVSGKLADEFTGALPESQVREFIDALLPSPAEPLRREALAAAARGDTALARDLLARALAVDPRLEEARLDLAELALADGALAEAQELIAALTPTVREADRAAAIEARLKLAQAGGGMDVATLRERLAANPEDLASRVALANALALQHEYREALEHLLEVVRRDRKFDDDVGRKTLLTLFTLLGGDSRHDELVREFRTRLARLLN